MKTIKKIFKSLVCLLKGHKFKTMYNGYSYENVYVDECSRCKKVIVSEWKNTQK